MPRKNNPRHIGDIHAYKQYGKDIVVPSTGGTFATYTEADLRELREAAAAAAENPAPPESIQPAEAPAPAPRQEQPAQRASHIKITRGMLRLSRPFAGGQDEMLAKLGQLQDDLTGIVAEYGGEAGEINSNVSGGVVLVSGVAFLRALVSRQYTQRPPHEIVSILRDGQPPSYTEIVPAVTMETRLFGINPETRDRFSLTLGGRALQEEVDAAQATLEELTSDAQALQKRRLKPELVLAQGVIPDRAHPAMREATLAVFPTETQFMLAPSSLLVPPQPGAPGPQA